VRGSAVNTQKINELTDKHRRKLFVGLTRAQLRVDMVMSEVAAKSLLGGD
jgi:hypothetical protein